MNYLDLFSGIGGFTLGLQTARVQFDWHGYSEIDSDAETIYTRHFPSAERMGDVTQINTKELPKINLITFGFPCQDLSVAGKRGGLEASRSGLFFAATRIIEAVRPDYFIFENVKGIFSSNNGADFIIILQEIADIGYDGQWQVLNTRWFLPQNRERIYFVGHLRNKPRPKIFPIGEDLEESEKGYACSAIDANYHKGPSNGYGGTNRQLIQVGNIDTKGHNSIWGRVYDPNGISSTINAEGGGLGAKTGLYKTKSGIRRLTPLECERLQGFPDGWTEGISDTQRYKCLGNAVSVPVVYNIALKLKKYIGG